MRKVSLHWVPYEFTNDIRRKRVAGAQELCRVLQNEQENDFKYMVTGDESWFYCININDSMWLEKGTEPPTKSRQKIGVEKVIISVFWNTTRVWLIDQLPEKTTLNVEYYIDNVLQRFDYLLDPDSNLEPGSMTLHVDNAPVHRCQKVKAWVSGSLFTESKHPPYSPDLAPSDYFLFGYIKHKLKEFVADDKEHLFNYIQKICDRISPSVLRSSWTH
ncbi:MAG: putative mariner transposase C9 mutant [Streblomastix strix]|uniref:Putative mariner transposase C9 mutant n=1 Tax=Streblomastix strix TaxID=222440 RepID=A0A5J4X4X7_9EUKA|nr:MAG: putative mariner transposase C9 mutant [Streblomastix strix]KAA6401579.1 MAG: putative mariner transposase C9 mutant [Streblomastix strix]